MPLDIISNLLSILYAIEFSVILCGVVCLNQALFMLFILPMEINMSGRSGPFKIILFLSLRSPRLKVIAGNTTRGGTALHSLSFFLSVGVCGEDCVLL